MSLDLQSPLHSDSLADVLERILDKGIVVAGDISVSLVGIELLTIRLRLLIATVDKAREIGINWWERDANLVGPGRAEAETAPLLERIAGLERRLADLTGPVPMAGTPEAAGAPLARPFDPGPGSPPDVPPRPAPGVAGLIPGADR